MTKLARILLAFVIAFVFSARMEAAAQHCARTASQVVAQAQPEVMPEHPCHMTGHEAQPARPAPVKHHPQPAPCECIAFGKGVPAPLAALAVSRIEPFDWERPAPMSLASLDLAPDGPPPKA